MESSPIDPVSKENGASTVASPTMAHDKHINGLARGPQAQRVEKDDETSSQVPKDAWEDHSGDFPPRIASLFTTTVTIRGGQLVVITGENFRGGVQVVLTCGQVGGGRTSLKVITPRIHTSSELEFDSPCLLDWWQQACSDVPGTSTIVFEVSLSCSGVVPDPDGSTSQFKLVGQEDSEVNLLHGVVELHRQVLRNTFHTGSSAEVDQRTTQRTRTLLELEKPQDVSMTEHLALGVMYMLCDSHDQISSKSLHHIMKPLQNGDHDILHLATILGLSTLVREICRHLLSHFDPESVEAFYSQDANNLTALDFATILQHADIKDVLEKTLSTAKELGKTVSAYQTTSLGSNGSLKSNPLPRPLPKLPSRERPNKAVTMPINLSPSMAHMQPPGTPPSPVPASAGVAIANAAALDRPLPPTPDPARVDSHFTTSVANPSHPGASPTQPSQVSATHGISSSAQPPLPPSPTTTESNNSTTTYEDPEPMYPPPTPPAPTSYAPPSHPPPPLHSHSLPLMPMPVPSGQAMTPVPDDFSHLKYPQSAPLQPLHAPPPPPPQQVFQLYPPPQNSPPPLQHSQSFPQPVHYAPPSHPPPPLSGGAAVYPGSPPTVHPHPFYPPIHPSPALPPVPALPAQQPVPAPAKPPHHHHLHQHQHSYAPQATQALQTAKLPSLSAAVTPPVPPPPPPRHKVTKVSRPKDFVIPASGSHPAPGTTVRRQTSA